MFCSWICPTYCYPSHKEQFSCHNEQCPGHAPVNTQLLLPPTIQCGQIQGRPELSWNLGSQIDEQAYISGRAPLPPHIQYLLHGINSPRDQTNQSQPTVDRSTGHEHHKRQHSTSQVDPVWNQSTAQVLRTQPSISRIKRGLYIGNLACIKTEGFLERMKITAVVSALTHRRGHDQNYPLNKAIPFDNQLFLKVYDHPSQDIIQHFPGVCEFIDKRLVCFILFL